MLSLCGSLEVIVHSSGLKTTLLYGLGVLFLPRRNNLREWISCHKQLWEKEQSQGKHRAIRFFLSMLIFMVHKSLNQNVNLLTKKIHSDTVCLWAGSWQSWYCPVLQSKKNQLLSYEKLFHVPKILQYSGGWGCLLCLAILQTWYSNLLFGGLTYILNRCKENKSNASYAEVMVRQTSKW